MEEPLKLFRYLSLSPLIGTQHRPSAVGERGEKEHSYLVHPYCLVVCTLRY